MKVKFVREILYPSANQGKAWLVIGPKIKNNINLSLKWCHKWPLLTFNKGQLLVQYVKMLIYIFSKSQVNHYFINGTLFLGKYTDLKHITLQLYGKVRTTSEDPEVQGFKDIQLVQNKLLRCLNGTRIKDKVSTSSLLTKFKMCSVNRLNAKVKLLEVWKSLNIKDYPLKIEQQEIHNERVSTRAESNNRPKEIGSTLITQKTCISDAIRVWNKCPVLIKQSESLFQAKKRIKFFVNSLPI